MHGSSSNWTRALVAVVVLAVAGAATFYALRGDDGGDEGAAEAAGNGIWAVGDEWTVTVIQDVGLITPDGEGPEQAVEFDFEVVEAPAEREGLADDTWIVRVDQLGQEGAFSDGWRLGYTETEEAMELAWVSIGEQEPAQREAASIVLGTTFPLDAVYEAPPEDREVLASDLGMATDEMLPPGLDIPEPTEGGIGEGEVEDIAPEGPPPGVEGPPSNG